LLGKKTRTHKHGTGSSLPLSLNRCGVAFLSQKLKTINQDKTTNTMSFQASSAKIHYEPGSWQEMWNDIYTGTVVGAAHSIYLVAKWWYVNVFRPILHFVGVKLPEDPVVQSKDGEKKLKVVAVGYGRTGTVSGDQKKQKRPSSSSWCVVISPRPFFFGMSASTERCTFCRTVTLSEMRDT
jgi:hypothetical protein